MMKNQIFCQNRQEMVQKMIEMLNFLPKTAKNLAKNDLSTQFFPKSSDNVPKYDRITQHFAKNDKKCSKFSIFVKK